MSSRVTADDEGRITAPEIFERIETMCRQVVAFAQAWPCAKSLVVLQPAERGQSARAVHP